MSSIVLDNSLETLFSLINAVVDESLPATPIWNSWPAETRSVDWVVSTANSQTFINNSIDEWKNVLRLLSRTTELTFNIFLNNVTNFTVLLILKVE